MGVRLTRYCCIVSFVSIRDVNSMGTEADYDMHEFDFKRNNNRFATFGQIDLIFVDLYCNVVSLVTCANLCRYGSKCSQVFSFLRDMCPIRRFNRKIRQFLSKAMPICHVNRLQSE